MEIARQLVGSLLLVFALGACSCGPDVTEIEANAEVRRICELGPQGEMTHPLRPPLAGGSTSSIWIPCAPDSSSRFALYDGEGFRRVDTGIDRSASGARVTAEGQLWTVTNDADGELFASLMLAKTPQDR